MKSRPAKRAAQGSPDVEESVPLRGRPRIDDPDRTATDKRRTQIRLAQRAYRERKESTISELTSRVALLERIVTDMNETFKEFHDTARYSSALQPPLFGELHKAAESFTKLIGSAAIEAEKVQRTGTILGIPTNDRALSVANTAVPPTDEFLANLHTLDISAWGYQAYEGFNEQVDVNAPQLNDTQQPGATPVAKRGTAGSIENLYESPPAQRDSTNRRNVHQNPATHSDSQQHYFEVPHVSKPVERDFPPEISEELALPSSRSYRETSFVRRLMRSSLEAAYMLMMNPKPEDMERLCTYAFCFINRPRMMKYFQSYTRA